MTKIPCQIPIKSPHLTSRHDRSSAFPWALDGSPVASAFARPTTKFVALTRRDFQGWVGMDRDHTKATKSLRRFSSPEFSPDFRLKYGLIVGMV